MLGDGGDPSNDLGLAGARPSERGADGSGDGKLNVKGIVWADF